MKKYAAYDDRAIWGVGDSLDLARQDAAKNLDHTRPEENVLRLAEMNASEMTASLALEVTEWGGNTAFGMLSSGVLGTYDELCADYHR